MDYCKIIKQDNSTFIAYAPAKLNINLLIGEKDETGMHKITSTMQAISLHDTVTLSLSKSHGSGMSGFMVKNNIISKALAILQEHVGKSLKCSIRVDKSIPIGAGMGGGSSDAAAALRLANAAFDLGLKIAELEQIASKVGNDVAFLLHAGRARVEGSFEHNIIDIESPKMHYIVARPNMELSTKQMYEMHDKTGKSFLELACELCPDTKRLLADLSKTAPLEYGITGKGPTVFAGYGSYLDCLMAIDNIAWFDQEIFLEHSIGRLE